MPPPIILFTCVIIVNNKVCIAFLPISVLLAEVSVSLNFAYRKAMQKEYHFMHSIKFSFDISFRSQVSFTRIRYSWIFDRGFSFAEIAAHALAASARVVSTVANRVGLRD